MAHLPIKLALAHRQLDIRGNGVTLAAVLSAWTKAQLSIPLMRYALFVHHAS